MSYKNSEGYSDPTGFEIVGRVTLRHKKSGRIFK